LNHRRVRWSGTDGSCGGGSQSCFEWKVIRFGWSLRHLVNALADLDAAGVAFVSVRDNLDLSTPSI
jgi:DNA invertase Pin-like site-specific DNA recombinase